MKQIAKDQIPSYFEYQDFLKNHETSVLIKNHQFYLKENNFISHLINLLPCAVYLLNYQTGKYLFVSDSCQNLLGYSANEMIEKGNSYFIGKLHPTDRKIISGKVFKGFLDYIKTLNSTDIKNSRFSHNYRFKRKDNTYIHLLQQYVVLETNEDNFPLLTLGFVTDVSAHKHDNKVVFSVSHHSKQNGYTVTTPQSFPQRKIAVTQRENQIIESLIKGLSSKQIADNLNISLHTANAHRRNILAKTNCKNTAELISYALENGLG